MRRFAGDVLAPEQHLAGGHTHETGDTVDKGRALYPRFIGYADGNLMDVAAVLEKMLGGIKGIGTEGRKTGDSIRARR